MPAAGPLGTQIGSYRVESKLGAGAMGEVFRAVHVELGRPVAIKQLQRRFAVDESLVTRFINEARSVNLIRHENIVEVTDFVRDSEGFLYMVMELLEGRSLGSLIDAMAPLPSSRVAHIGVQIAEAVHAAHLAGIIHRDLKPENIFLIKRRATDDYVKLLDFGIAQLHPDCGGLEATERGTVIGSPVYMPPEQAKGEAVTPAADVYALGVVLYEMVSGKRPFDKETSLEMMMAHIADTPLPLDVPSLPPDMEALIKQCLAKDPSKRPGSMAVVASALESFSESREGTSISQTMLATDKRAPEEVIDKASQADASHVDSRSERSISSPSSTVRSGVGLANRGHRWPLRIGALVAIAVVGAAIVILVDGPSDKKPKPQGLAIVPDASQAQSQPRQALDRQIVEHGLPPIPLNCQCSNDSTLASLERVTKLLLGGAPGSTRPDDLQALRLLAEIDDSSAETILWRARAHLFAGDSVTAGEHAKAARVACPDLAAAHATEGTAHSVNGNYALAIPPLQRAVVLDPDYLDARFNLAVVFLSANRAEDAIAAVSKVLVQDPQYANARYLRGRAHLAAGAPENARDDLEAAVIATKDNAHAWSALGKALSELGDLEGARVAACQARELGDSEAQCPKPPQ